MSNNDKADLVFKWLFMMMAMGMVAAFFFGIRAALRRDNSPPPPSIVGTVDGCTIYRFQDQGHDRNFVRCSTGTTAHGTERVDKSSVDWQVPVEAAK